MKKTTLIFGIIIFVAACFLVYQIFDKDKENSVTDAIKFSEEYTMVDKDNLYVYKTQAEILNILQKGTGIVFLGFPECPACQRYVRYLNEVAKEENVLNIYYYNILKDRKENTEFYQEVVNILKNNLLLDENANPRIFVPDVTFVRNGSIIAHDNETSVLEEGISVDTYWTSDKINSLKLKLKNYIDQTYSGVCDEGCNQ